MNLQAAKTRPRTRGRGPLLGQIALRLGLVTPQVLQDCLDEQRTQFRRNDTPLRLGLVLLRRGAVSLDQLLRILREQQRLRPEEECRPPAFIGKYRILGEIARGGMAVIYEAADPHINRRVALKVLKESEANDDGIQRLCREARLAARLSHPNIVVIHELGQASERPHVPYIAMEHVSGETLQQAMPRLPLPDKVRILKGVAETVGYVHRQGIVHRDLKPANILLSEEGRPVLLDFGLARPIHDPLRLTQRGEILGTPVYLSPEQLEGMGRISPATDVWALGVVLYEMLTGQEPFPGTSSTRMYRKIREEEPIAPRKRVRDIPRALEGICLKALQKDPALRYRNGDELAQDLRSWLEPARGGRLRRLACSLLGFAAV